MLECSSSEDYRVLVQQKEEMVNFWILFCRSVLEQSCVVWGPSLTQENVEDLERTQKSFAKLVLRQNYKTYDHALVQLNLESLEIRRKQMLVKFAKDGIYNNTMTDLFPLNNKKHKMETRKTEKYKVNHANTERLKTGSIISMQKLLNEDSMNS